MTYINPDVNSSYKKNNLGKNIYNVVLKHRPKKIVEFGTLEGYSTISMALALKEMGEGHIYSYDLWEKYPYKHSTISACKKNLKKYDVEKFVTLGQIDFYEWLKDPEDFDLLHIDISNDGDILNNLVATVEEQIVNGSIILFEGGSQKRDEIEWMIKYNKKPIFPLREKLNYDIINKAFPSISMIKDLKNYD